MGEGLHSMTMLTKGLRQELDFGGGWVDINGDLWYKAC